MASVLADVLPQHVAYNSVYLSGPSFALEVARSQPTAVTIAGREPAATERAQLLFQTPAFRAYTSDDVVGVELGGALKNVIAVAAGKGGVGKSTVAVNLALALQRHGAKVGLLDCDVFGPSIPTMLGAPEVPPSASKDSRIIPAIHQGVKVISVGFFVDKDEAVVWRGPMVHRLLQQFLGDVDWGDLDYLVCDLPPGTGDVQLSLSQLIPIAGSVMVTTPQEVSIVDVVKGIAMFEKVEIPILGIVENMSYYKCPACGHHDEIFSHGGGKRLAQEVGTQFFGEIPIDTRIRFGGDAGVPVIIASPDSENAQIFMDIASKAALSVAKAVLSKPKRSPRLAVIK
jgi:ATP-binding protein involved in chromosome partitioning